MLALQGGQARGSWSVLRSSLADKHGREPLSVYTLGIWKVQAGRENDFVRAWSEMANNTKADFTESVATLLQEMDEPRTFISFGPWESLEQIEQWRSSDTFKNGVGRIRSLLDDFTPHTMQIAARIE
jgi:heme-degrading monooxygenase HmoA